MKRIVAMIAIALVAAALSAQTAAPAVSEKQDIAIFALGFHGYAIPWEALGSIDMKIQKVFADMGRFRVIAMPQRMSAADLQAFIEIIRKNREENFELPEKFRTYEAVFTEADFNKIINAFIVAVPVVTSFQSYWDEKAKKYVTDIRVSVTFINPLEGSVYGIAEVSTRGSSDKTQLSSMVDAVDGIPMELTYEIKKISAFQIKTRILQVAGSEIKLQLGQDMGINVGDEYAILSGGTVAGFSDVSTAGLVIIKQVGKEVSTGYVVFSDVPVSTNMALEEIARFGVNAGLVLHYVMGQPLSVPMLGESASTEGSFIMAGLKSVLTLGAFDIRYYLSIMLPLDGIRNVGTIFFIPGNLIVGAEYVLFLGRLTLVPYGGVGVGIVKASEVISGEETDPLTTHVGAQAYISAQYLFGMDVIVFVEAGFDYWLSIVPDLYSSYGGLSVGVGFEYKF